MLRTITLVNNTSVNQLTKLWAERYVPDLSIISSSTGFFAFSELIEAASPEGRAKTVAKLQRILEINCKCAGIQTNVIFSYIPNVVSLTESQGIARCASQVYQKVLEIYQKQLTPPALLKAISDRETVNLSSDDFKA